MKLLLTILKVLITVLISGLSARHMAGQDETQPLSPLLDMVSVDPATGFAIIRWLPSPSPDVGSYVVYTFSGGTATAIDTVRSPYITEYTHTASAARYRSVAYVVAAVDSSLNISPLSNSLSTVWLIAEDDICTAAVTVTWTRYENPNHPATGYLLNILTETGGSLPAVTLPYEETTYTFTGYEPETGYCFHVTAVSEGTPLASSNSACVTTGSEVAPEWVKIDAITVSRAGLRVYTRYDPATVMNTFRLYRYNTAASSWEEAATSAGTAGEVFFNLPGADTTTVNLFRVSAVNSCGLASTLSEPARNMVLAIFLNGTRIDLRWNRPSLPGSEFFSVWRDTGDGPRGVAAAFADTTWSDDYEGFAGDVTAAAVVYHITAKGSSSPEETPAHRSSAAVIEATENIFMPNAFTPAIPGENAIFMPQFTFMPSRYDFRIWSRTGVLLFSTTDPAEGWDGRHNGVTMPPGVYLWSLKLTTPSGRTENRNGTVTILP
ncbi:MAG: gliding motility-associated C-terminal domain-containing protein [Bacteroidales bacterium]|nr:gliding motility-associated C-terminal domain-containing protein [Bacteroidales bacterium]